MSLNKKVYNRYPTSVLIECPSSQKSLGLSDNDEQLCTVKRKVGALLALVRLSNLDYLIHYRIFKSFFGFLIFFKVGTCVV